MLQIDQISKTFNPGTQNEVYALRRVSLTVPAGSFLIVLGTNGSGKSTLLNAIAGTFIVDGFDAVVPFEPATQAFGRPIPVCSGASSMAVAPAP